MRQLTEILKELQAIDPDLTGNAAAFEGLLAEVVELREPEAIRPLLGLLRDDAEYDELMFSIVHGIEVFDDPVYVAEVLQSTPSLFLTAPQWAATLFIRILNSGSSHLELVKQLPEVAPEVKASVRSLMEQIHADHPEFLAKTGAVMTAAAHHQS